MTNIKKRILVSIILLSLVVGIFFLEKFDMHITKFVTLGVSIGMIAAFIYSLLKLDKKVFNASNLFLIFVFLLLLISFSYCSYKVGERPWTILMMLIIISSADMAGYFFGSLFKGSKMWESLSPNKTWSGQIFGIIFGTVAIILFGFIVSKTFMPQMLWIGIGVSLLSQYGDLTASFIKRKLGIKDFSNVLPGHGGIIDRFDGWIYVLPIIYFVML